MQALYLPMPSDDLAQRLGRLIHVAQVVARLLTHRAPVHVLASAVIAHERAHPLPSLEEPPSDGHRIYLAHHHLAPGLLHRALPVAPPVAERTLQLLLIEELAGLLCQTLVVALQPPHVPSPPPGDDGQGLPLGVHRIEGDDRPGQVHALQYPLGDRDLIGLAVYGLGVEADAHVRIVDMQHLVVGDLRPAAMQPSAATPLLAVDADVAHPISLAFLDHLQGGLEHTQQKYPHHHAHLRGLQQREDPLEGVVRGALGIGAEEDPRYLELLPALAERLHGMEVVHPTKHCQEGEHDDVLQGVAHLAPLAWVMHIAVHQPDEAPHHPLADAHRLHPVKALGLHTLNQQKEIIAHANPPMPPATPGQGRPSISH